MDFDGGAKPRLTSGGRAVAESKKFLKITFRY
jgi:hypothetical protein